MLVSSVHSNIICPDFERPPTESCNLIDRRAALLQPPVPLVYACTRACERHALSTVMKPFSSSSSRCRRRSACPNAVQPTGLARGLCSAPRTRCPASVLPPLGPAPTTALDSTSTASSFHRISPLSRFGGEASESRIRWISPLPSPFVPPFCIRVPLDFLCCLISTRPSPSLEVSPCCIRVPRPCAF